MKNIKKFIVVKLLYMDNLNVEKNKKERKQLWKIKEKI